MSKREVSMEALRVFRESFAARRGAQLFSPRRAPNEEMDSNADSRRAKHVTRCAGKHVCGCQLIFPLRSHLSLELPTSALSHSYLSNGSNYDYDF